MWISWAEDRISVSLPASLQRFYLYRRYFANGRHEKRAPQSLVPRLFTLWCRYVVWYLAGSYANFAHNSRTPSPILRFHTIASASWASVRHWSEENQQMTFLDQARKKDSDSMCCGRRYVVLRQDSAKDMLLSGGDLKSLEKRIVFGGLV